MMGLSWAARCGRVAVLGGLVASGSLLFGAAGASAANKACPAAKSSTPTSCTFTSGTPLFTVPAGVGSVDVVAVGAAGGSGVGNYDVGAGGQGASVEDKTVPVVPGNILGIYVGTVGQSGASSNSAGIPGGGPGGNDTLDPTSSGWGAGGGGGFSGVVAPNDSPLVIAGGGGGGGESVTSQPAGSGGAGDTGSGGGTGGVGAFGGSAAGGGTATGGGAAGTNNCPNGNSSSATAGSSEQGGAGIDSGSDLVQDYSNGSGGGGGGGFYGGGGGGAGCTLRGAGTAYLNGTGNGGGGGSSYGITGLTNEQATSQPASVTISWAVPTYMKSFGSSGTGNGQFGSPEGIAIDPSNGVMYVADQSHRRIEAFDSGDNFLFSFRTTGPPLGIAGDFSTSPGMLYVTEPGTAGGVQMFDGSGYSYGFVSQVPGSGKPLLTGVAVDPSNQTVYVADSGNNQIDTYNEAGTLQGSFDGSSSGTPLDDPTGVAVDSGAGRVYVSDGQNHRVAVFDTAGNYVSAFGSSGTGAGQFTLPDGVAVQPVTGYVFVVDGTNNRVESFAPDGTYIHSFGEAGSGTGGFKSPWGVAFAPDGSFFVTDSSNYRVQKWGVPGPLASFAISMLKDWTAGTPTRVRVTAFDASGDLIESYHGLTEWQDIDGQLNGNPAPFSHGVSISMVTIANPAKGDKLLITNPYAGFTEETGPFNVLGPLARFVISVSSAPTHGTPFTVKVYAKDSVGNVLGNYSSPTTWSDSSGQITGSPAAFTRGVSTNQVTVANPYSSDHITVTNGSVTTKSAAFNIG